MRLAPGNDNDPRLDQDRRRLIENLVALVWVALLVAGAYWLVAQVIENNRQQECLARGYRNCLGLDIPERR